MPTGIYKRSDYHRKKISDALIGHEVKPETRLKIKENHARQWLGKTREDSANWKGDLAGYGAMHDWIRKEKGSPLLCDKCGKTKGTTRNFHWSNISGDYKRDFADWQRLCVSCHKLFDLGKLK